MNNKHLGYLIDAYKKEERKRCCCWWWCWLLGSVNLIVNKNLSENSFSYNQHSKVFWFGGHVPDVKSIQEDVSQLESLAYPKRKSGIVQKQINRLEAWWLLCFSKERLMVWYFCEDKITTYWSYRGQRMLKLTIIHSILNFIN